MMKKLFLAVLFVAVAAVCMGGDLSQEVIDRINRQHEENRVAYSRLRHTLRSISDDMLLLVVDRDIWDETNRVDQLLGYQSVRNTRKILNTVRTQQEQLDRIEEKLDALLIDNDDERYNRRMGMR